jgi:hypothetical protein
MKANPELAALPLTDDKRLDYVPPNLIELADHLDSALPNDGDDDLSRTARVRGERRREQGYPLKLLICNERLVAQVISNVVYENLLSVDLSYLLLDLNKLSDAMLMQLEESVDAYQQAERRNS